MGARWDVEAAIAAMRSSGCFYLRPRKAEVKALRLWSRARLDKREVNRDMLTNWFDERDVYDPYTLASKVMTRKWTDEFEVLEP